MLFYIDRSLTAPLLFAPGSLSSYPYARTPEELLEKVEEAQRQIEDGGPLSYTQFKRVWQYIVTRSTKERTYVRYINGQKIQHTGTPKLGEKAAHNGNVVYSLDFSDNSALVALHIYHEFDLRRRRSENGSVSGRA